ncbi:tryptophan synthase subunit alpha [Bacillus carboniphilus]|uniref:Tryptophan synthase alpha chain n=1 Tax=Bacillus carboniphilus TaxID=86663 RepID=A0ABY9JWF8_9BACI|nr:tryptophan synthase subunit alpha [Bacillus carboniphilus]WLR43731.1 tryptophan synthase subunit alpha [Bacillus carboniphilus]
MSKRNELLIQSDKPLFIPYIVAGDPSEIATIDIALSLQKAGASALELGVPYSDPLADGPTIQRAASRSLKRGMSIISAMCLARKMKKAGLTIPIILFTYYNPVLQLGNQNFFALMKENAIEGLLIPDLPFEESEALRANCQENSITFISLLAPTSMNRLEKIVSQAQGFLYCVSSLGVTGERKEFDQSVLSFVEKVKEKSDIPVVVGFGISTREQVQLFQNVCDGVIVGSAIINKIEQLVKDHEWSAESKQIFDQYLLQLLGNSNLQHKV